MDKKVSIIIPNYNRAHLILKSLESISVQTYLNWECIIIDDRSTDNSIEVIKEYLKKDSRFKLSLRPLNRLKGANSSRNYGFELSEGFYVHWFDSDDIMTPDHISSLVSAIESNHADFAVGESLNFEEGKGFKDKPYNFDRVKLQISASNFGKQKIGWITDDFLSKKEIIGNLRFNEKIKTDGDEYNFFTQLLHSNTNGIFVNKTLTYRRVHQHSLSNISRMSRLDYDKKIAVIKFITLEDIEKYENIDLIQWFLKGYMQYAFQIALVKEFPPYFIRSPFKIAKYFNTVNAISFLIAIFSAFYYKKGYLFLKRAKIN